MTYHTFYAVQKTPDDDWSRGSFISADAVSMLRKQGCGMISILSGEWDCVFHEPVVDPVCTDEITYEDIEEMFGDC